MKFKIKDLKNDVEELKMKLRHSENRNSQKEEYYSRLIEDNYSKHESEIEALKKEHLKELEILADNNYSNLASIKDLHEIEVRQLHQKINELKSQMKVQDLQIMEFQQSSKNSVNSNLEILETIHLRYLDEIKSLNLNLSSFKTEKENELKSL